MSRKNLPAQESQIPKLVVITGGPCAGKSTILKMLFESDLADKIIILPEVANMLIKGGYPLPATLTRQWQDNFQDAVFNVQLSLEAVGLELAREKHVSLILLDRGTIDGSAYFAGGLEELSQRYNQEITNLYRRYQAVVYLDSLANYGQEMFTKYLGMERFHSYEESLRYDATVKDAWSGHKNIHYVQSRSLPEKYQQVYDLITALLTA